MYVIKKMQLNKLKPMPIVSNRALFLSCGPKPATIESKDTPDCATDPVPYGSKPTQLLGLAQDMIDKAYEMRDTDGNAVPLTPTNPVNK